MINKKLLESLKADYQKNEKERRQIISASNNILFEAKRVIFKIQREDFKEAESKLKELEENLASLEKRFGQKRLLQEGSYKAAAEEYIEGKTFFQIIKKKEIGEIKNLYFSFEAYIGGICDLIGEMVRYSTNQAAKGKFKQVSEMKSKADEIMSQLIDFDMTGYLRTKYDQARGHLRKLEQMSYEIKLRGKK